MTPATLNSLATVIYAQNVERGWWDDPNRSIYCTLQLVNTEIAEATEGDRKDLQDDHLPDRKMVEVEMADTLIRLLDLAGRYRWKYDPLAAPHEYVTAAQDLAGMHFALTAAVCNIAVPIFLANDIASSAVAWRYSVAVSTLLRIVGLYGYDIEGAVADKLTYNATRADHSREARAHFDGKKY